MFFFYVFGFVSLIVPFEFLKVIFERGLDTLFVVLYKLCANDIFFGIFSFQFLLSKVRGSILSLILRVSSERLRTGYTTNTIERHFPKK